MTRQFMLPRLMLLSDLHRTRGRNPVTVIADAVEGGAGIVQLREPGLGDDELIELVRRVRRVVPAGTEVVVHDRPSVALATGSGLHMPAGAELPAEQRDAVRERRLLYGCSAVDAGEARVAIEERASYILFGRSVSEPAEPGPTGRGAERLREISRQVRPIPLFARGAVTAATVPGLIHAGAHGVAVREEILDANHPRRVAQALVLALEVATVTNQRRGPDRLF